MIRVGFVLEGGSWRGGINYYRNLLSALEMLPGCELQPVLFVGTDVLDKVVSNFYHVEIVRSSLLDSSKPVGILRRVIRRITGQRDMLLMPLMIRHKIDVLSHSGPLWPKGKIKTIGWIADFQHLHLPEFFSASERAQRNALFKRITCDCERVVLSSKTAQYDLAKFAPEALGKSMVIHFVPEVKLNAEQLSRNELEKKYDFYGPYFFLPNQFWIHKNHKVVIEALAELKKEGIHIKVLATGDQHDYRHPFHFQNLMDRLDSLGLSESFKVLGIIPYDDMISLMRHSLAVINPSLFEGWSSTVEEAKVLEVTILLSDLPVHREQNPSRASYFDPVNSRELASMLRAIMAGSDGRQAENIVPLNNNAYLSDRLRFAREYQDMVVQLQKSSV